MKNDLELFEDVYIPNSTIVKISLEFLVEVKECELSFCQTWRHYITNPNNAQLKREILQIYCTIHLHSHCLISPKQAMTNENCQMWGKRGAFFRLSIFFPSIWWMVVERLPLVFALRIFKTSDGYIELYL